MHACLDVCGTLVSSMILIPSLPSCATCHLVSHQIDVIGRVIIYNSCLPLLEALEALDEAADLADEDDLVACLDAEEDDLEPTLEADEAELAARTEAEEAEEEARTEAEDREDLASSEPIPT